MNTVYAVLFFLLGTLMASFAHLVGLRLPRGETLLGRSRCPSCLHELRLWDVFPVLGYLVHGGRCHFCKTKISGSYPLVELLGGLSFLISFLRFGFTWELPAAFILVTVLILETVSDITYGVVIDRVWIVAAVILVILRIVDGTFLVHLFAMAVLTAFMVLVAVIGKAVFKKEALGGGDIKLFLFFGWCLIWSEGLLAIFLASFFGFLWATTLRRNGPKEIAWVPFLAIGVLIAYLWGSDLIAWYLHLLGV